MTPSWQDIWNEEKALGRSASGSVPRMFFSPGKEIPEPKPTKKASRL